MHPEGKAANSSAAPSNKSSKQTAEGFTETLKSVSQGSAPPMGTAEGKGEKQVG